MWRARLSKRAGNRLHCVEAAATLTPDVPPTAITLEIFVSLNHTHRNKVVLSLLPALLFAAALPAGAAEPVTIASVIPYANDQVGTAAMRAECQWNTKLPAAI